jgi:RNA polymerase subunit RPABC4/transcription elongation factor Spt4
MQKHLLYGKLLRYIYIEINLSHLFWVRIMVNLKLIGGLVTLGGFVGFILSAIADIVGLSINKDYGPDVFGPVQYGFVTLGIVIAIIGVIIMVVSARKTEKKEEVTYAEEEIEAEEYECPSCGAVVTAEATSCGDCGEVFEREEFECPSCGAIVAPDANTCPECGEEFEVEEEVAAVPPTPTVAAAPPTPAVPTAVPEGEEEEEYECPSCGGVVGETDTVCPNCGEEFE